MGPLEITFEMGNWGYKQDKWSEISLLINGLLSPSYRNRMGTSAFSESWSEKRFVCLTPPRTRVLLLWDSKYLPSLKLMYPLKFGG